MIITLLTKNICQGQLGLTQPTHHRIGTNRVPITVALTPIPKKILMIQSEETARRLNLIICTHKTMPPLLRNRLYQNGKIQHTDHQQLNL